MIVESYWIMVLICQFWLAENPSAEVVVEPKVEEQKVQINEPDLVEEDDATVEVRNDFYSDITFYNDSADSRV